MMMFGQALFATGKFEEAAGATQMAMHALPKEKWGVVVSNYKDLYGNTQDYTTQLRALEKSVGEKPNDPALRFLAGFHYAYLGHPQLAIDQLDKALKSAPQDEIAKLLRDEMRAKLPKPTAPAVPVPTLPVPSV
jgi:tetratricopeptide (TPR) repeat protein